MIGVPKRSASTHSRARKDPGRKVDADLGVRDQAPQVHAGIHRHPASEGTPLPRRRHRVLDDHHVGILEGGAEPCSRFGRLGLVAGAVAEDQEVVREAKPVVPVPFGEVIHGHVHADRMVTDHQLEMLPAGLSGSPGGRKKEHAVRSGPAEQIGDVRRQLVHNDGRVVPESDGPLQGSGWPQPLKVECSIGLTLRLAGHKDSNPPAATGRTGNRSRHEGQLAPPLMPVGSHHDQRRPPHSPGSRSAVILRCRWATSARRSASSWPNAPATSAVTASCVVSRSTRRSH